MIDEILVSVAPGETRIACLADGRAVEFQRFLHGRPTTLGNVYLGRVTRVVPGLGAAFVEFGHSKAGFLTLPTEAAAAKALHEGARVLIQVTREAERGKGAQVSTTIRIPGRLLVFAPEGGGIHIARRIGGEAESERLSALIAAASRSGEGWIARTNAAGASATDIAREAETLRALWANVTAAAAQATPPAVIHSEPPPVVRVLRDKAGVGVKRIAVDDHNAYVAAMEFLGAFIPELQSVLKRHAGPVPLFEQNGIEEEFESIGKRRVGLPSGGSLVIEGTEALWAIDVNTGRNVSGSSADATILATNMEAASEVARQIRLRDMAGLLVIDFVHMDHEENRRRILQSLTAALADDPSPVRIAGFSELGLVELSRKRTKASIADAFDVLCPACEGSGIIAAPIATALAALRAAQAERATAAARIQIRVSPKIADAFATPEGRVGKEELASRLGKPVDIIPDSTLAPDRFKLD